MGGIEDEDDAMLTQKTKKSLKKEVYNYLLLSFLFPAILFCWFRLSTLGTHSCVGKSIENLFFFAHPPQTNSITKS